MFDTSYLEQIDFSKYERIGVAYSGGVDSSVLLHSLSLKKENKKRLFGLHINHRINSKSDLWEKHCKEACFTRDIEFVSFKLDHKKSKKLNENDLREARYKKLFSWAKEGDVVCTAHHKDDQVETILFRILRGTGIKGLQGIKKFSVRKNVDLVRPLLNFSKKELIDYALINNLSWIEDESNTDLSISRNYIRNKVIPLLAKQLPHYSDSFINLSLQAKDAWQVLEEIADMDLGNCLGSSGDRLSILKMDNMSKQRIKNLMLRWLSQLLDTNIPISFVELIYRNMFLTRKDLNPIASFGHPKSGNSFQIRRFHNHIYFLPQSVISNSLEASNSWSWNINSQLVLPTGTLSSRKVCGKGLSSRFSHKSLVVKARAGGERCKPFGRSKSQKLKKLFQEYKVPPWLRNRLPLIFIKDEIAAVADLWVCEKFQTEKDKYGFLLKWSDNLEQNS